MSTKEEREFQISIAELTADVQIYLSIGLALAGISIAYTIGLQQIYFSLPSKSDIVALSILFSLFAGMALGMIYVYIFIKKADKARKDISKLKEKDAQ
jgi:hypothetical protein